MRQDLIVIQSHDPEWGQAFETQRAAVEGALASWLVARVEHIGSTSVPGLPAKPIIDMLALIDDYDTFGPARQELEQVHWVVAPEPGDEDLRKWSACFPTAEHRTHHLHVVERNSSAWRDWLLFRDYLRTNVEAARRYAELKRELAAADHRDRVRYRAGKAPLIAELMERARLWSTHSPSRTPAIGPEVLHEREGFGLGVRRPDSATGQGDGRTAREPGGYA
ncbi:GrpB family protein [Occultella gossypii]|uniref:GrpB family protein n=1 Tax=Occultella gossypii TaxID=2800820 RepID=A0ABS7SDE3_9MICO|nr:GrpB family protein [Occultella gossypii]MBZ2198359.1 GrpB family protein [Occultella gossypii]